MERFVKFHLDNKGVVTIAVSPLRSPFAVLDVQGNDIVEFREKPLLEDKLVSAGIYVFNKAVVNYLPMSGAIERTGFQRLAKERLLKAYRMSKDEGWITINSIKDLSVAETEFETLRRL